ncbi:response regulator [Dyella choica]|uniref:histidine kinase n=1 Tax=Dyella choica TaxID=1927959 RepID=A0A432M3K2_9GAMM|nr:response regulator [Dyella choica]RUL73134.1 response regulator [Dyella choica]
MVSSNVTPTPKKYGWLAHLPIRYKIILAIGLLLGLFFIDSLIDVVSGNLQSETRRWVEHTNQVIQQIGELQRTALSGQVGLRGFLLTQEPQELDQAKKSNAAFLTELTQLQQMTSDNPLQQSRIDRIKTLALRWDQELQAMVFGPMTSIKSADRQTLAAQIAPIRENYLARRTVHVEDYMAVLDDMVVSERQLLASRVRSADNLLDTTRYIDLVSTLIELSIGLLVISLTSRMVARPIRRLGESMTRLANHDHNILIRGIERRDEIGEISRALQVFRNMVMETHEQAQLKSHVTAISTNLQSATNHREFAERFVNQLAPSINAGVALFYGFDESRQRLDLLGSYGLRIQNSPDAYMPGEGLVGQCAASRLAIVLDDVPANYLRIDWGGGSALPRHLTILPLMVRDQLVGVLEFAGFTAPTAHHEQLLEELLPLAALTLENLNRTVNTEQLLEQTREQADELRISSVTMRQQQEALRSANDTLQSKTIELEEQSQRLLASEEELRVQADELQASNEELRLMTESLRQQKQQVEALQRDTAQKAEELARASQYKSEFLANMSHELRTPLNSLLILSRSLSDNREGHLDDEEVESARIIHDSGSGLLRLINDILDLSKIEAGKMELSLVDYPLQSLARNLRRNFDHVAREKKLDYEVALDAGLPETIHTDPTRLEQIANNLLGNAFKFTQQGSIRVHIGRPGGDLPVAEIAQGSPLLAISVKDTGIGIPANKLERIFNAFEQADSSTSRQFGGTGLGLSISRRMAGLMGGDIVLRSEVGQGSEFVLLLPEHGAGTPIPTKTPTATANHTPVPRAATRALLPAEGMRDDRERIAPGDSVILVVEDDPAFARILADMVRQKGHHMLHAPNGEAGLELARRYHPVGILLDVMLPGMDGWTVIERLKADPVTRHIPVHFLTATDDAGRGRELGAVGFLTKPVSREAINQAFERLLHFAEGRSRHLLVIDDDAAARRAVHDLLSLDDDVEVDEVGNGEEALEMIAGTGYDCIVLDLDLPGMSGLELLEKLATSGSIPPVVVYSGRELSREENLAVRQYTDSIVIKGARSPERLLDEVSLFLHSIRDTRQSPGSSGPASSHDGLRDHNVLLVDDDMRNLFALSKVLRDWGIRVSMAQDGQKALQVLGENPQIELVLMDIMMPGMDGYEATRAIRARPDLASLPIIALTAKAMRGDRERCLEAGANDYLSKPIDVDKLASLMRMWLRD